MDLPILRLFGKEKKMSCPGASSKCSKTRHLPFIGRRTDAEEEEEEEEEEKCLSLGIG